MEFPPDVSNLQRQIKEAYLCENYDKMGELNAQLSEIAATFDNSDLALEIQRYQKNVEVILQHSHLYADVIKQILWSTEEFDDYVIALQLLEERLQNELADREYERCLDTTIEILGLVDKIRDQEKFEKYSQLRDQIDDNIVKKINFDAEQEERLQEIEDLKRGAEKLESDLLFNEARAIYGEIIKYATEIGDNFSVTFCEQKVAQIEIWEQQIENSELAKKEIPPFRLIHRARYDCLEAFGDEKVAKQRLADLVALGVKKQNVEIVTIVRGKFKEQAPYNKKGECFAIYVRKTLD